MRITRMHDRHDQNSAEYRVYTRFSVICKELIADLDPVSGQKNHPALTASSPHLVAAAIDLLKANPIRHEDWDCYLQAAFETGNPELLEAAVRIMPHGQSIPFVHQAMQDIVRVAPVRHILIAVKAGIGDLCLTKDLVQSAITRNDPDLQDAIIAHVAAGGKSFTTRDWLGALREKSLQKGADFLGRLLPIYVQNMPQGAARGLNQCALDNRMVHAVALHIAGARGNLDGQHEVFAPSNHQILAAMGNNSSLMDFLKDPMTPFRVKDQFEVGA